MSSRARRRRIRSPERAWWRWASRNVIPVSAILPESAFKGAMPSWEVIDLGWEELKVLPTRYRTKLSEWRAIYFIFGVSGTSPQRPLPSRVRSPHSPTVESRLPA